MLALPSRSNVASVAWSPDGQKVLTGHVDGTVVCWDAGTGAEVRELKITSGEPVVEEVAFSADGQRVHAATFDGVVTGWDLGSGAGLATARVGAKVWGGGFAFSKDRARVLVGGQGARLSVWAVAERARALVFPPPASSVGAIALTSDGSGVLVGTEWAPSSFARPGLRTLQLWSTESGGEVRGFDAARTSVFDVAVSPDDRLALSSHHDGSVHVWALATGAELRTLPGPKDQVRRVAFAPDGRRAVGAGQAKVVVVWDVDTGAVLAELSGHTANVADVAVSPDGTRAITAGLDGTARLWALPPVPAGARGELPPPLGHASAAAPAGLVPLHAHPYLLSLRDALFAETGDPEMGAELFDVDLAGTDAAKERDLLCAAADVAVRELAPPGLEGLGMKAEAAKLRALRPITDVATARAAEEALKPIADTSVQRGAASIKISSARYAGEAAHLAAGGASADPLAGGAGAASAQAVARALRYGSADRKRAVQLLVDLAKKAKGKT